MSTELWLGPRHIFETLCRANTLRAVGVFRPSTCTLDNETLLVKEYNMLPVRISCDGNYYIFGWFIRFLYILKIQNGQATHNHVSFSTEYPRLAILIKLVTSQIQRIFALTTPLNRWRTKRGVVRIATPVLIFASFVSETEKRNLSDKKCGNRQ